MSETEYLKGCKPKDEYEDMRLWLLHEFGEEPTDEEIRQELDFCHELDRMIERKGGE